MTAPPEEALRLQRPLQDGSLRIVARGVEPNDRVLIDSPQVRALHGVWFRKVVPFVGGIVSDRGAYAYLPASTAYLPSPSELALQVAGAGFDQVELSTLGFGAAQLLTGTRA